MKVLILTTEAYENWIWHQIKHIQEHDIHCYYADESYPFQELKGNYDIGISFMYTHKVPAKEVNTHTWFNFHPAPLPEYRGRDLCYHAIMSGATRFGATLHYMDENFDTGEIIAVHKFPILPHYTAEDVSEAAIGMAETMFSIYFPEILSGKVFERLPNIGGTYFKKGNILEEVPIRPNDPFGQFVRAVTYKDFAPRIDIGGRKYKIVRDE